MIGSNGSKAKKIFSNGSKVRYVYSLGQLVYRAFVYAWEQFKAVQNMVTTYYWDKYSLVTTERYYNDSGWYGDEEYDVESVSGYTSMSFSESEGFVGSGYGTLRQTGGPDVYDVSGTSAIHYYYDSSRNMIRREFRTCSRTVDTGAGSYVDTVSSTNPSAYPDDGSSGYYWYVYDRSESKWDGTYKKGEATGVTVTAESRSAYSDNGKQGDYWYVYKGEM